MGRAFCMLASWVGLVSIAACDSGAGNRPDAGGDASPGASPDAGIDAGQRVRLRIEQPASGAVVLEVWAEVARSEDERRRGLRGHAPLAADEALLIELPFELDGICVVNDGVDFGIDAVFARADGLVVAVERLIPAGDGSARCHDDTRWIVETASGQAHAVEPGALLLLSGPPPL